MVPPPDPVTVHTSWRGLISAAASPLVLLAFAVALVAARGVGPVAVISALLGLGLGLVALLDYPRRAEFSTDGVLRVCVLRRQLLPWSALVAIERTSGSARDALRRRGEGERRVVRGGLVARAPGKRRFLLTDRAESRREFEQLRALMDDLGTTTVLRAPRPGEDVPPTDLYRRRSSRADRP